MTREEAIRLLNEMDMMCSYEDDYGDMIDRDPYQDALDMAIKALEQQPKTGHWEKYFDDYVKCSKCGELVKFHHNYKHCPNCGSYMTESEEKE